MSFSGVLWTISEDFRFRVGGVDYAVPGFMLWAAISYAVVGSLLSYFVGRSLIRRNADRYAREADLRFSLVRINEHVDGIALAEGEADERRRVEMHLGNVMIAMRRLVRGLTNLTWVTAGFGWITGIAPILIAAPLYFGGKTTFGGMMMAAAAFTQAQGSLRWFVDNFGAIADWRATLLRVANFRSCADRHRIPARRRQPDRVRRGCTGRDGVRRPASRFARGARGVPGATRRHPGRRARADLRSARRGEDAALPRAVGPLALGQRSHRPAARRIGDVRAARHAVSPPRHAARSARLPVGHGPLRRPRLRGRRSSAPASGATCPSLDANQRWDRELSEDEQMALALARVVLHDPPWVVFDDTFSSMEDETLERVIDMFAHDLSDDDHSHRA